ncbi:ADP-ribosylglycohydrolase family protein [Egibacter rhizosphaerae]|uniref:ADP-ribosylglycohydrolase family protein n=1 Tax=Egibacter rhizosphaerae TaxID=1670831 RepID=A0A411YDJ0_9ACTN|nr:ADP-ribosylglycohydrolase family protein [Egibacter rhizosphaerae]QBI19236.1 ADP-ribosylglycohydrolase family protein [Egibacter rhizosphaerae]
MSPDPERTRQAAPGALLGTLVGDALGAPYEGSPPTTTEKARGRLERALARTPRPYTDDTQMALALAQHLLGHPHVDPDALAAAFRDAFEPWRGYGGGMHRIHDAWECGLPTAQAARVAFAEGSLGNGAAMRIAPIGVRWGHDPERLADVAARSAQPTHVHPVGEDGAVVQARAVGRAVARGGFTPQDLAELAEEAATDELARGLAEAASFEWPASLGDPHVAIADRLGHEVLADRSVPTACWVAATSADPGEAMLRALGVGGDTDTIAAMAVAIRGAADGGEAVPGELVDACEGSPQVRAVADELADAALGGDAA